MVKKLQILISIIAICLLTGCFKETYNMDRLSSKAHLSPTFGVSAVRGDISLSDLIEASDTVVYEEDNFVKLVYRKDSVIEFGVEDFYDLDEMFSFSKAYPVGGMRIAPFAASVTSTLDQISLKFPAALRTQFVTLDDGAAHPFPSFSNINLGNIPLPAFTNFSNATFESGFIDISVRNNLTAPINSISIRLYNTVNNTLIGGEAVLSLISPGQTKIHSVNLSNVSVSNSIYAVVVINNCPGTSSPVLIDLDGSNIQLGIAGRDLKVLSGLVKIPVNTVLPEDETDIIILEPGQDIEITEFLITTGTLSYTIKSNSNTTSIVEIELPTVKKNGSPITRLVTVAPYGTVTGNIDIAETKGNLDTETTFPYNRLPLKYAIVVHSNNTLINFSSADKVQLDIKLVNTDFDYIKGYFGQLTETDVDMIDLDIDDILKNISGTFLLSSPSIKFDYLNSFALPVEINLQATGYKGLETVDLDLNPFNLVYPSALAERDKSGSVLISKSNSNLPGLVSMPPGKIRFQGSAKMNPLGKTAARDNYIFGDSRFISSAEIVVPMELRINNLQFTDTVDNFIRNEDTDDDSSFNPADFEFLRIDITAKNRFPLGVSLSMTLFKSAGQQDLITIDAENILQPAPVDAAGKVTGPSENKTSIIIDREFWDSIDAADKIIFRFTMISTENTSKDVKIYSDYNIEFKAAMILKPDFSFDLD